MGATAVGNRMLMPQKAKHRTTTLGSSNPTPGPLSRENHASQRHRYASVHRSTLCNSQDMETTQVSIDRGVDQEAVVHTHHGNSSAIKRKERRALVATWMDLEIIV